MPNEDELKAFLYSRIEIAETGCWLWKGATSHHEYGVVSFRGHRDSAHGLSYRLHKGPHQNGLVIDHLCRNHTCCNPDHLEAVTVQENAIRGHEARGTSHLNRGDNMETIPRQKFTAWLDKSLILYAKLQGIEENVPASRIIERALKADKERSLKIQAAEEGTSASALIERALSK